MQGWLQSQGTRELDAFDALGIEDAQKPAASIAVRARRALGRKLKSKSRSKSRDGSGAELRFMGFAQQSSLTEKSRRLREERSAELAIRHEGDWDQQPDQLKQGGNAQNRDLVRGHTIVQQSHEADENHLIRLMAELDRVDEIGKSRTSPQHRHGHSNLAAALGSHVDLKSLEKESAFKLEQEDVRRTKAQNARRMERAQHVLSSLFRRLDLAEERFGQNRSHVQEVMAAVGEKEGEIVSSGHPIVRSYQAALAASINVIPDHRPEYMLLFVRACLLGEAAAPPLPHRHRHVLPQPQLLELRDEVTSLIKLTRAGENPGVIRLLEKGPPTQAQRSSVADANNTVEALEDLVDAASEVWRSTRARVSLVGQQMGAIAPSAMETAEYRVARLLHEVNELDHDAKMRSDPKSVQLRSAKIEELRLARRELKVVCGRDRHSKLAGRRKAEELAEQVERLVVRSKSFTQRLRSSLQKWESTGSIATRVVDDSVSMTMDALQQGVAHAQSLASLGDDALVHSDLAEQMDFLSKTLELAQVDAEVLENLNPLRDAEGDSAPSDISSGSTQQV